MTTCKKIIKMLDLYLDGELDNERAAFVAEHLEKCPFCSSVRDKRLEEKKIIQESFPLPEISSNFKGSVISQIASRKSRPGIYSWFSLPLAAALAGCFLFAGVLSFLPASPFSKAHNQPNGLYGTENYSKEKKDFNTSENEDFKISKINEQAFVEENKEDVENLPDVDSQTGKSPEYEYQPNARSFSENPAEGVLSGRSIQGIDDEQIKALDFPCFQKNAQNNNINFSFAYLPHGFKLEKFIVCSSETRRLPAVDLLESNSFYCGEEPLFLTFSNQDTKERFYVGIIPLKSADISPQELFFSIFSDNQAEEIAGQPFFWYMEKEGQRFLFGIIGEINSWELEMVAASSY